MVHIFRSLPALGVAAIYAPVLADMARIWRTDAYAGHGMYVPLFSALLLWKDRNRIRAAAGPMDPAGILLILLALGILGIGKWADSILVRGFSVVAVVAGTVLFAFGRQCLRQAAFPIAFLLFMVPLPRPAVDALTRDLQLLVAGFAGAALETLSIPSFQSGLFIALPTITLEVAEVCNGLRFLMALLVFTVALAHVSQRTLRQKLVLVASVIPIALLANAIRIATIAIAVHYVGPQAASGFIHHSIGKGVWALTFLPLIALALWLRRTGARRSAGKPEGWQAGKLEHSEAPRSSAPQST